MVVNQLLFERKPVFIITNSFRGAEGVAERLEQIYGRQLKAAYFETASEAFAELGVSKFDHVFIDSDVGFQKAVILARLKMRSPSTHLHVFEEGVGTYRTDLYEGIRKYTFPIVGIATHFGASPLIDRVFVLNASEYRTKFPARERKIHQIAGEMSAFITAEDHELKELFGFKGIQIPEGSDRRVCRLYLSNWTIDEAKLERFKGLSGDIFFKPHPQNLEYKTLDGIVSIDGGTLAEVVITELAKRYQNVEIYDHGTSVRRYIKSPRVTFKYFEEIA